MGWTILIILILAGAGFFGFVLYKRQKGMQAQGAMRIYKAFQEVQLVIMHESKVDKEDLVEFVKGLAEKDTVFGNDKPMLDYIEEYYKKCVDLNKKNERIRITQTKEDLDILMGEKARMVEWFRQQDRVIRQHFAKYVSG